MKAGRADQIAYPDVGYQLVDLVSQQPDTPEVKIAKVKRQRGDDYRARIAKGLNRLEQILLRQLPPLSNLGHMPRPAQWDEHPAIFHNPHTKESLKQTSQSMTQSTTTLQEMADDLVADAGTDSLSPQNFVPPGFRGLLFRADPSAIEGDPVDFIRERSLWTVDELRQRLFLDHKGSVDSSQKSAALLQFRSKLDQLQQLANWIETNFSELDHVQTSRAAAPQLC